MSGSDGLAKLCGRQLPDPFETISSRVELIFSSNQITADSGFKIKWEMVQVGNGTIGLCVCVCVFHHLKNIT